MRDIDLSKLMALKFTLSTFFYNIYKKSNKNLAPVMQNCYLQIESTALISPLLQLN